MTSNSRPYWIASKRNLFDDNTALISIGIKPLRPNAQSHAEFLVIYCSVFLILKPVSLAAAGRKEINSGFDRRRR
jgi:hypothetical protein